LHSRAARIGPISMSDVGTVYFGGSFATLFLSFLGASSGAAQQWLALLAFLTLPYTLFSVGYQALKLKQYCPLCLGVQAVLWMQALWLGLGVRPGLPPLEIAPLLTGVVGFGAVGVLWAWMKPTLAAHRDVPALEARHARLERDPAIIHLRLQAQDEELLPATPLDVVAGASQPRLTVTTYISPHCPYCTQAHVDLAALLKDFDSLLQVRYRMLGAASPEGTTMLRAIAGELEHGTMAGAVTVLDGWYLAQHMRKKWSAPPSLPPTPAIESLMRRHDDFAKTPPFPGVPTTFVGTRRFPETMSIETLRYLLESLRDEQEDGGTVVMSSSATA